MAASLFYTPRWRAIDANGDPIGGAVLAFFEAGTSTPLPVYADVDWQIPWGVEVTADSGGLFPGMFMLPQAYYVQLWTAGGPATGVMVWDQDDFFPPQPASSANVDITGTAGVDLAAGEPAYLSDGSGGLNAGQWYPTDADLPYASTLPQVAFPISAILAGASGLFRENGKLTGLSGLTPGARYFVSATAGAITTTEPPNSRYLGQAESTTVLVVSTVPPPPAHPSTCEFRLTLTSGVPVTTADVTAATTVYCTPYKGNRVDLFTGATWVEVALAELSIAVPATTNTMYDVFLDWNDGAPALAVTAWTNDTTRATALTTQDGIYVKSGDTQQRYLGSFRTTGVSGQTEDSAANRLVYNYYNRVPGFLAVTEPTASWNYSSTTLQQARNQATNQVALVVGVAEDAVQVHVRAYALNTSANVNMNVTIGANAITQAAGASAGRQETQGTAGGVMQLTATLTEIPAAGYRYYTWLEAATATGTTTWLGRNTSAGNTLTQAGIFAAWRR